MLLSGCGDGVQRVRVSGQATFQGKPIPYGNITFEPDTAKGNQGPQGYTQIRDGKYDTDSSGVGPCPGPQLVHIVAYPDLSSGAPRKSMRVIDFHTNVELPRQAHTHDFEVPASAARVEGVSDLPPP
jgi:hypothetical protein